jgi:plasmid stabilization system protein ParE
LNEQTQRCNSFGRFTNILLEARCIVREFDASQIREVIEGPYRIIYYIKPDQIDVLAVIHSAQHPPWS